MGQLGGEPEYQGLADAFGEAAARCPEALTEERLVLAGRPVRLRIVGRALARQATLPFVHLRAGGQRLVADRPELTVDLWDEGATGVPRPARERQDGHPSVSTPDANVVYHRAPGSLTALDRRAGRAIGWRAGAELIEIGERAKPLPVILPLWCLDHGVSIVHGAAVARAGTCALIAGAAGAGKSTWSLACAGDGLAFLGDDQVALEETDDGDFVAQSLYATARLDRGHLESHPRLACGAPMLTEPGQKVLLHLGAAPSTRLAPRARIGAILLPGRDRSGPGLERAERGRALLELAPTSLLGVIGGGAWGFERLGRLVERVPAYWALQRESLDRLPALVARALAQEG